MLLTLYDLGVVILVICRREHVTSILLLALGGRLSLDLFCSVLRGQIEGLLNLLHRDRAAGVMLNVLGAQYIVLWGPAGGTSRAGV